MRTTAARLGLPLALLIVLLGGGGCANLEPVHEAIYGQYHRLSPATGGIYITIKRHASDAMMAGFDGCKAEGHGDSYCGTTVLRIARDILEDKLSGAALQLWNGDYSVYGYHPDIGKGFRDEEGGDFATAVRDLRARGHACLRIHWKPTGTNWTTCADDGVAECSWGTPVQ